MSTKQTPTHKLYTLLSGQHIQLDRVGLRVHAHFQIVTAMHRYVHSINYTCQTALRCYMFQYI